MWTAPQDLELAVQLINRAKKHCEEARCELLRKAIEVLVRGGRGDRRQRSLPSTGEAAKLEALLEDLLDHPSRRLAVYGTLAPGEENHQVIAQIQGTWERGWVPGVLGPIGPFPAFRWKPGAKRIPVKVLSSSHLPRHWIRLDRFEGAAYRRILAPVTIVGERALVSNIYEGVAFIESADGASPP